MAKQIMLPFVMCARQYIANVNSNGILSGDMSCLNTVG